MILAILHKKVQCYLNLFNSLCHPPFSKMNKEFLPLFEQFQELFQNENLKAADKVEILEDLQSLFVKEAQNEEILAELAPADDSFFHGDEDESEEVHKIEVLRSVFGELLSEGELKGLVNISEFWEVSADEVIVKAGADLEGVYFTVGECVISLFGGGIQRPKAFLGLESLFYTSQSSFTVKSIGSSKVVLLPKAEMTRVMKLSPHLTHIFAQVFWSEQFFLIEESLVEKEEYSARIDQYGRIFNNLGQALFTIDSKGEIGSYYSSLATTYLGYSELAGRPFADIILRDNAKGLKSYYRALSLLFSGNHFDPEVIIDLLPSEVELAERVLKLYYQFAEDKSGYVVAITVRVDDITQELVLQKEAEQTEANRQKEIDIQEKIKENIASYLSLIDLIDLNVASLQNLNKSYVKAGLEPDPAVYSDLMTSLHTIKGLSGQFDLSDLKTQVHMTETVIQKMSAEGVAATAEEFKDALKALKKKYRTAHNLLESIGDRIVQVLQGVNFTQDEYESLLDIAASNDVVAIRNALQVKTYEKSEMIVENWEGDVKKISEKLGKKIKFTFEQIGEVLLPQTICRTLNFELGHIYRNAVDHGIEVPAKRLEQGKEEEGILGVSVELQEGLLIVKIKDDGAGINEEKIIEISKTKEMVDQSVVKQLVDSGEAWRILFLPGFSSSDEISEISGRGVGLEAVDNAITSLGGVFSVESSLGEGTCFSFCIPLASGFV